MDIELPTIRCVWNVNAAGALELIASVRVRGKRHAAMAVIQPSEPQDIASVCKTARMLLRAAHKGTLAAHLTGIDSHEEAVAHIAKLPMDDEKTVAFLEGMKLWDQVHG